MHASQKEVIFINSVMTTVNLSELFPARFRGVAVRFEETDIKTGNYTLVFGDASKVIPFNTSAPSDLIVPSHAQVPFFLGTIINIYNMSIQPVNIISSPGVTLRNTGQLDQFNEVSLRKRGTNEWVVVGALL